MADARIMQIFANGVFPCCYSAIRSGTGGISLMTACRYSAFRLSQHICKFAVSFISTFAVSVMEEVLFDRKLRIINEIVL